jgi:alkanesulfonate monooxygenase SsuD/methylene tetrahydromethanopterin reductase-like flavin-dependent oxidoreductase (luciferase family)
VIVGGAFRLAARRATRYGDGMLPAAPSAGSGNPEDFMPRFRKMAEEAGRDLASLSVTLGGAPEDLAVLRRNRDLGVTRHDGAPAPGQRRGNPARFSTAGRS